MRAGLVMRSSLTGARLREVLDYGKIEVAGVPAPQWLTPATLDRLRKAANWGAAP